MIKYYAVFFHKNGYGNCQVTSNKPIATWEDMELAKNTIEESNNVEEVVIFNLIELVGDDE